MLKRGTQDSHMTYPRAIRAATRAAMAKHAVHWMTSGQSILTFLATVVVQVWTFGSGAEPSSTNWPPRSRVRQAACLIRCRPAQ